VSLFIDDELVKHCGVIADREDLEFQAELDRRDRFLPAPRTTTDEENDE
jgi:hypothetical protein